MSEKFELLDKLARKGSTFKFQNAAKISCLDIGSLKVLLSRMEKDGWIERIEKGKYLIIPLGAKKGKYTINEFVIGSTLVEPAIISYWSALNYHGLTEQVPTTVFIQTTARKKKPELEIFGVKYKIIKVNENKLVGYETIWIDDAKVHITDQEKTIADCLDKPQYCGGIIEVAKALQNDIDLNKIIEYAKNMNNSAILKRLGYLCDKLGIPIDISYTYLAAGVPLLDPSIDRKGTTNRKWKIMVNMDEKMLGELE
jgi:predicted transcriptional regulator of viral defense system